jgi:hypothetical protein
VDRSANDQPWIWHHLLRRVLHAADGKLTYCTPPYLLTSLFHTTSLHLIIHIHYPLPLLSRYLFLFSIIRLCSVVTTADHSDRSTVRRKSKISWPWNNRLPCSTCVDRITEDVVNVVDTFLLFASVIEIIRV